MNIEAPHRNSSAIPFSRGLLVMLKLITRKITWDKIKESLGYANVQSLNYY
jgi:hypothetical protein